MHFSAFHPSWKMMDVPPTPVETLVRARQIALDNGVNYAYTGNVHDVEGESESTYCHSCHTRLIGRDWYVLSDWNLDEKGCCKKCSAVCAGVFEDKPGAWGDKRMPVQLKSFA